MHEHVVHYGRITAPTEFGAPDERGFVKGIPGHPVWQPTSSYVLKHSHDGGGEAHEYND